MSFSALKQGTFYPEGGMNKIIQGMINLIGTHSIDQLRLNSYLIINSVRHYAKKQY